MIGVTRTQADVYHYGLVDCSVGDGRRRLQDDDGDAGFGHDHSCGGGWLSRMRTMTLCTDDVDLRGGCVG